MRRPGRICELDDGRRCIIYNDQPLIAQKKLLLHLIDEDLNLIKDEHGKEKTLIKTKEEFNEMIKEKKIRAIGFVD